MKYLVTIVILIIIGFNVFQLRNDRKQDKEITELKAALEASLKTDTVHTNLINIHQNNFAGVDYFGAWVIPIAEAVKHDTMPTWKDYSQKHLAKDNKK